MPFELFDLADMGKPECVPAFGDLSAVCPFEFEDIAFVEDVCQRGDDIFEDILFIVRDVADDAGLHLEYLNTRTQVAVDKFVKVVVMTGRQVVDKFEVVCHRRELIVL